MMLEQGDEEFDTVGEEEDEEEFVTEMDKFFGED